jgi:hypothetical protein
MWSVLGGRGWGEKNMLPNFALLPQCKYPFRIRVSSELTRVNNLSDAFRLLALPTNIGLDRKGLPGTDTLFITKICKLRPQNNLYNFALDKGTCDKVFKD